MARTTINLPYKGSFDEVNQRLTMVLQQNGFKEISYNGENVWKKGTGMLTAMQYIKTEFGTDQVVLQAWVQAGLGSLGGSEMDLSGVVAAAPKRSLMKVIEKIKACI